MAQYKCKYFSIKELVNPDLLKKIGEDLAWSLFDPVLLKCADNIRAIYGPCTINTGGLVDCGLRDINSNTGAKYSMHKLGRALDLHIRDIELKHAGDKKGKVNAYNQVRERLMALPQFDHLCFEYKSKEYPDGISWLHIDTGNRINRLFNA